MSNNIRVKLIGAQTEVFAPMLKSRKNICAVLPVGSGKSFLAALLLPIAATTESMNKGRNVVYVAPSWAMIDRIIWKDLKKRCIEHWGLVDKVDINNSEKTITFPNGVQIMCLSAETGLKGFNASLIIADEAAEYSQDALEELTNRIRPVPGQLDTQGRLILISTPEGKNVYHDFYQMALSSPESWIVFHKNYKQMKVQSKAWIEEQRKILSPLKFAKDFECSWGSVEDQFFYTFKRSMIVENTTDQGRQLYTFHDFNKKRMCAIVAQVIGEPYSSTGRLQILKTYALYDCSTEQIAMAIRADYPQRTLHCIMDRSGAQVMRDTTSVFGITDQTILEKYGFRIINQAKGNPLISDTDNSSNAFIASKRLDIPETEIGDGKLVDAVETFHYEDGARKALTKYKEAKYMSIDGLGDALRYGLHYLFPMRHLAEDGAGATSLYDDQSFTVIPGSEYMDPVEEKFTKDGRPTIKSLLKKHSEEDGESDFTW